MPGPREAGTSCSAKGAPDAVVGALDDGTGAPPVPAMAPAPFMAIPGAPGDGTSPGGIRLTTRGTIPPSVCVVVPFGVVTVIMLPSF